jgi:hypothetical protein
MDNPQQTPNVPNQETPAPTPEPTTEQIHEKEKLQLEANEAAERLANFEAIQEQVNKNAPQDPAAQPIQKPIILTDDQKKALEQSAQEETKTTETDQVPASDMSWVDRAEDIIEKDKEKPFQEEEDAEKLQKEYLSKRFDLGVDVEEDKK